MKDQRQIPHRNPTPALWFVPMKTVQQPGQVLILADANSGISHFVGYGSPIAFYGTRLKMFLLKKGKEKIRNLLYRGSSEVHLILLTPSDKNGPL